MNDIRLDIPIIGHRETMTIMHAVQRFHVRVLEAKVAGCCITNPTTAG